MGWALAAGIVASAAGVALVRLGWSGARRIAVAGWLVVAAALLMLVSLAGAWGLASGGVAAMLMALALLAGAGWATPAGRARPGREAPSVTLPRWGLEGLGRRGLVFLLVVPVGFAAAQLLAFGFQVSARRSGWPEADSVALMLLAQPVAWAVLASFQMMAATQRTMAMQAIGCAALGLLLLWWPL